MSESKKIHAIVLDSLKTFMRSSGRQIPKITSNTHLICGLGLKSDEGVDFVLDLCDALKFELPTNFNPFVHDDGKKGRTFGEMADAVARFVNDAKVAL